MSSHSEQAAARGFDIDAAYARHGAELFGFAVNALADRHAAEECVQDVFTKAWRARDTFDPDRGSLRTWLFGIARRAVIDEYRRRGRRESTMRLVPDVGTDAGDDAARPDATDGVDARMVMQEAVARLSGPHREVIVEIHLRGRSYAEVAAATGVPAATLRTRMYHGLRALRSELKEVGWRGNA